MDLASLFGTFLGLSALVGGQLLAGSISAVWVVLIGTAGAVLLSNPMGDLGRAIQAIPSLYFPSSGAQLKPVIEEIVRIAAVARKEGVLAVESQRESIRNPHFKKSIKYVLDGFDAATVREIIDAEIALDRDQDERPARLLIQAGRYASTIGIVAASIHLAQAFLVMEQPAKLGSGLSSAFLALVYGPGLGTLFLIPWGTKLMQGARGRTVAKEVVKLGVTGIQEGLNPMFLQSRLEVFMSRGR